jgi:DNA (cytosine-5)-methyltransferase 1
MVNHEIPDELYNLDILDGSPPCSVYSMAGLREKAWIFWAQKTKM